MAVGSPLSKMADTLRTVKVTIDHHGHSERSLVIGVVSAVAGEGKSTISANLAMLLGAMGSPTLLVDGDLRLSGLTKAMGVETGRSLADAGQAPLSALVTRLSEHQVWFLPCSASAKTANSSQVLGSPRMREFLQTASAHFQYIVVDLPPLCALVDAKAIAPHVNSFLLVIEWGKTSLSTARDALAHNMAVNEKCIGAVLNKVDAGMLALYDSYDTHSYGYLGR
jgi:succinoglycan biosynthesis transport protein ExoP